MLRGAARGALTGVAWAMVARLFMRLLAPDPAFTWVGTLMIVALAGLLWAGIGAVSAARQAGRSRGWRVLPVPGLLLFAGAGMILIPGIAGTAIWFTLRQSSSRLRRRGGAVAALAGLSLTAFGAGSDGTVVWSPTAVAGIALVMAATVWAGAAMHEWWRRWTPRREPATADGAAHDKASSAAYG